uniref:Putative ethylene monooxygenase protein C n=1 Tax=Haliea sp. ETY-NAG TaxID=1055106 RepID=J7M7D1_9GAMM|nr:putative ethylene monooxygenase protein C [Haliea sp. ETY-NAG]
MTTSSNDVRAPASDLSDDTGDRAWKAWLKPSIIGVALISVMYIAVLQYQDIMGWKYGLDSTSAEFDKYWMTLFWSQIIILPVAAVAIWAFLWFTRDRDLSNLDPKEEVVRYLRLLGLILLYTFCIYWAASYFAEQDGSWHQTVVRDTSITPSHIAIFYLSFPVYIIAGVSAFLYAMTRLPKFANGISIPFALAVTGPFMILPNVGLNEWGHAFWIMEEWFTAPLHWGFVVFGWSALALFGLASQIGLGIIDALKRAYGDAEDFRIPGPTDDMLEYSHEM